MSEIRVYKHSGAWTIAPRSTLRTGISMRRGEIRTQAGTYTVEITDFRRLGVVARANGRPVVRLHPNDAQVPGPGGPARWSPGRHSGTLARDDRRITVRLPLWPGRPLRVETTGAWPDQDLVVLTTCFALLTARRRRAFTAMAIAGATGHG